MMDASSTAGRELARCRWGTTRLETLLSEIEQRRDDLTEPMADRLRAVLAEKVSEQ